MSDIATTETPDQDGDTLAVSRQLISQLFRLWGGRHIVVAVFEVGAKRPVTIWALRKWQERGAIPIERIQQLRALTHKSRRVNAETKEEILNILDQLESMIDDGIK